MIFDTVFRENREGICRREQSESGGYFDCQLTTNEGGIMRTFTPPPPTS